MSLLTHRCTRPSNGLSFINSCTVVFKSRLWFAPASSCIPKCSPSWPSRSTWSADVAAVHGGRGWCPLRAVTRAAPPLQGRPLPIEGYTPVCSQTSRPSKLRISQVASQRRLRVAKFKRPRVLSDQKVSEDNQKLRPGCPPDYQIFVKKLTQKYSSHQILQVILPVT